MEGSGPFGNVGKEEPQRPAIPKTIGQTRSDSVCRVGSSSAFEIVLFFLLRVQRESAGKIPALILVGQAPVQGWIEKDL